MSTVVVVKKNGVAAIGADTLTKLGSVKESAAFIESKSKIVRAGEGFFASVGHASFGLVLSSYLDGLEEMPTLDSTRAVFEFARTMHVALKDSYFLNPSEDSDDEFESSQSMSLIAGPHGIFGLYRLRSVQEYTRFWAFGTGFEIALGAMHAVFEREHDAAAIAMAGLEAAGEFDSSTAAPFEIHTIAQRER